MIFVYKLLTEITIFITVFIYGITPNGESTQRLPESEKDVQIFSDKIIRLLYCKNSSVSIKSFVLGFFSLTFISSLITPG